MRMPGVRGVQHAEHHHFIFVQCALTVVQSVALLTDHTGVYPFLNDVEGSVLSV